MIRVNTLTDRQMHMVVEKAETDPLHFILRAWGPQKQGILNGWKWHAWSPTWLAINNIHGHRVLHQASSPQKSGSHTNAGDHVTPKSHKPLVCYWNLLCRRAHMNYRWVRKKHSDESRSHMSLCYTSRPMITQYSSSTYHKSSSTQTHRTL